jgi:hypothetical protein
MWSMADDLSFERDRLKLEQDKPALETRKFEAEEDKSSCRSGQTPG